MRRSLSSDDAQNLGTLDAAAIGQVTEESWPVVRDEHELHDALLTLSLLPPAAEWRHYFEALERAGRASVVSGMWVATERLPIVQALPEESAVLAVLRGWMDSIGPVTPPALAARLALPLESVEIGLAQLEAEGVILRGHFASEANEFCHRRILARIHRLTLGRLRKEIEPVTSADFIALLLGRCAQHLLRPGTQLHGADGVCYEVLRQLQRL